MSMSVSNAIERVLDHDLADLVERLASSVPEGNLECLRTSHPTLKIRLDEMDASLARVRAALLESYGRWGRALEDLENLWALAAWRSAAAEDTVEKTPALAA